MNDNSRLGAGGVLLWPQAAAIGIVAYIGLTVTLVWLGLQQTGGVFVYAQDDPYIHLTMARTLAHSGVWGIRPPAWPQLSVLDVGQGDAILLADGGHAALIDGGGFSRGDIGGKVLLPALLASGVRQLDVLAMTHPDLDACVGFLPPVAFGA